LHSGRAGTALTTRSQCWPAASTTARVTGNCSGTMPSQPGQAGLPATSMLPPRREGSVLALTLPLRASTEMRPTPAVSM